MAIGKWSMRFCGVLFLVIGIGALVVALVPSLAESFVENAAGTSDFGIGAAGADTVRTTCWILAATFLPSALLFFWMGQWFKSMEPSFDSMMQSSAQMARTGNAFYQQAMPQTPIATGTGVITGPAPKVVGQWTPPGPSGPPVQEPPDPTAGGIIS